MGISENNNFINHNVKNHIEIKMLSWCLNQRFKKQPQIAITVYI